jgi:hypothetical protein
MPYLALTLAMPLGLLCATCQKASPASDFESAVANRNN